MAIKYLSPDGLSYFWTQIKGMLSTINTTLGNHTTSISNIETWEGLHRIIKVSVSSFSSLPQTVTDSRIKANDEVVHSVLSNPGVQEDDWTVATSAGSLTISGTISGTTSLTLYLTVPE